MSGTRFSTHIAGSVGSNVAGHFFGGPVGVVIGVGAWGYEHLWDDVIAPIHQKWLDLEQQISNAPQKFYQLFGYPY